MQPHGEHLVIIIGLGHGPHLALTPYHQFLPLHGSYASIAFKGSFSILFWRAAYLNLLADLLTKEKGGQKF
jgi:hypothetical protein